MLPFTILIPSAPPGRTLEETAVLFDGDEQPQDLVAMGGEAATMTMEMSRGAIHHTHHEQAQKEQVEFLELRPRRPASDSDSDLLPRAF